MKKPPRTSSERLYFYLLLPMLLDGNISFQKVDHSGGQFVLHIGQNTRIQVEGNTDAGVTQCLIDYFRILSKEF